jgi:hypothetical protein
VVAGDYHRFHVNRRGPSIPSSDKVPVGGVAAMWGGSTLATPRSIMLLGYSGDVLG